MPTSGRGAVIGLFLFWPIVHRRLASRTQRRAKNAFLTAIYCVIVPFLFWLVGRQRPDIYNFTAAVLCIAGIGFCVAHTGVHDWFWRRADPAGWFLFAAHLVAVTKFGSDKDPCFDYYLAIFLCRCFSWITTLISEPFPTAVSVDCVWGVAYLSFFVQQERFLLQNIGQKVYKPVRRCNYTQFRVRVRRIVQRPVRL